MIAIALVIPQFADDVRSDTYDVDFARRTGMVEAATETTEEALADAVEAYQSMSRLAIRRPNSAPWRAASRACREAILAYAAAAGMGKFEATAVVAIEAAKQ